MPTGLRRYQQTGRGHFLTWSCYRRLQLLATARRRRLFVSLLERVRRRYRFVVLGYVVMPEHVHLLISEPERGSIATVVQVIKQRVARRLLPKRQSGQARLWEEEEHFWQKRYWAWSSYRAYAFGEVGKVRLNEWPEAKIKVCPKGHL